MIENKRFTLKNWNDYAEGDCIYYDDGEEMGSLDVLDALNSLSKEKEYLKIRFKEERDTAMRLGRECDNLTIKNQKLELEIIRLEEIIKTGKM